LLRPGRSATADREVLRSLRGGARDRPGPLRAGVRRDHRAPRLSHAAELRVMSKWTIDEITVGATMETTFWANPKASSEYRFRATHLDGRRAPKVVLSNDSRIRPGVPCRVRVAEITKPDRSDHGYVLVDYEGPAPFKIEGVYVDPIVARKLQVLLESGLNILLDG